MPTIISEKGEVLEKPIVAMDRVVLPAVTPEEAKEAWRKYEELKKAIKTPDDIQKIQGREFLKKSYWKKCATFFNLSIDRLEERRIEEKDGSITFETTYHAVAPNGRVAVGDGACNTHEKKDRSGKILINSIHNTRSTAHTRAANRAISNLVGGGEVSAEEMPEELDHKKLDQEIEEMNPFAKTSAPASISSKSFATISPKQASRFVAKALSAGLNQPLWEAHLKQYGYSKPEEIKPEHYEELCAFMDKKKYAPKHKDEEPPPITDEDIRY